MKTKHKRIHGQRNRWCGAQDANTTTKGKTEMTTTTLTISTNALSDHMDRLYDLFDMTHTDNGWNATHVDGEESGFITIIKRGDKTTKVAMTRSAINEFISDMDYQIEVSEDWDVRAYRTQCKRALTSIRKQLAK